MKFSEYLRQQMRFQRPIFKPRGGKTIEGWDGYATSGYVPPNPPASLPYSGEWDDDDPILYFANNVPLLRRDTYKHLHIFGGTGRGKSSGAVSALLRSMLRDYGGLITTVKPGDIAKYKAWIRQATGTLDHVIEITLYESCPWQINPFDYMIASAESGVQIENLVSLCTALGEVGNGGQSEKEEKIWRDSLESLLRNTFVIFVHSQESITWEHLSAFFRSLPNSPEEAASQSWQEQSYANSLMNRAATLAETDPRVERVVRQACGFFFIDIPRRSDATQSSVLLGFQAISDLFVLNDGLHHLFGTPSTTFTPELCWTGGAILLLAMPVLGEADTVGLYAQTILKSLFQKAALRRDPAKYPRSCFQLCDENQLTLAPKTDSRFQQVARESRIASIACTQSLTNYYAALGGGHSHDYVDAYLSNFGTFVFHGNGCKVCNGWAAESISKGYVERPSVSGWFNEGQEESSDSQSYRATTGTSEQIDYLPGAMPRDFTLLKCQNGMSEAIIFGGGEVIYPNGQTFLKMAFPQDWPTYMEG